MVLELHVWGPAFSLPSVDAQCLAAITYLSQAVPRGEWVLVASSDLSLSPTNELPALRNGSIWIGGFRNIIDYISKLSGGQWDLDADLEGLQKADCTAYSAFLESRGQELLDLSLYVSSHNYINITRPLFTKIQTFPLQYVTPSTLRSAAKARTAHLGFSELDIDSKADPEPSRSVIPESLRRPKPSLQSLLSQPEHAALIRLDALAADFFSPLQKLRSSKRFFVTQFLTSVDCLALGYLSLALLPDLPSSWLADCMRKKYPQLCAFVHDLQSSFFGGNVTLEDAGIGSAALQENELRARGKGALPWQTPEKGGLIAIAGALGSSIADSIPVISQLRQNSRLKEELEKDATDEHTRQEAAELAKIKSRELWTAVGSVVAGVGLFIGFLFHQGVIALGESRDDPAYGQERPHAADEEYNVPAMSSEDAALTALGHLMSDFELPGQSQQMSHQEMSNQEMRERNEAALAEVEVEPIPDGTQ